ncbi:unnamed protein product [Rhodiola kirilowii]
MSLLRDLGVKDVTGCEDAARYGHGRPTSIGRSAVKLRDGGRLDLSIDLPSKFNFTFLEILGLRSIIYLCRQPFAEEKLEFISSRNIQLSSLELKEQRYWISSFRPVKFID